jgi:superfamily I DNA and RNA helicase
LIDLDRIGQATGDTHDTILHKCYRNPREILISAHALGFGIYSTDMMVQMLENKEHWKDVGYEVIRGNCVPGEETIVERPSANSPLTISAEESRDELVRFYVATNIGQEVAWVTSEIKKFLAEGLRADDMLIVALDDQHARSYFKLLTDALHSGGIQVNNLLLDPYSTPSFSREDLITLSTVYRAKGNEAPVVFAVGVDAIYPGRKTKQGRNKLFTAFTRAKAWLRVSGVGLAADYFRRELENAMEFVPRMEFVYPELTEIELLQRDLSEQAGKLGRARREMEERLEQLALSEDEREALIEMLLRKKHE